MSAPRNVLELCHLTSDAGQMAISVLFRDGIGLRRVLVVNPNELYPESLRPLSRERVVLPSGGCADVLTSLLPAVRTRLAA